MWVDELIAAYVRPMTPIGTDTAPSGRLSRPVECLLLDVYGTLLISASGDVGTLGAQSPAEASLADLCSQYQITGPPDQIAADYRRAVLEEHQNLRGQGVDFPEIDCREIWSRLFAHLDERQIRRFALAYELIVNPVYPMPGAIKIIEWARHQGIALGIVSNAQFYTPIILEKLLRAPLEQLGFDHNLLFWSYRSRHAKPSSVLFQQAVKAVQGQQMVNEKVLYVGNDMLNDVKAAADAGFQTALFAGDARSLRLRCDHPECRMSRPDVTVTAFRQLIDYIQKAQ